MIIFNLDGTLADSSHRQHFVYPIKHSDYQEKINPGYMRISEGWFHKITKEKFKPDWKSFYEACDQDKLIKPVIQILREIVCTYPECEEIQIWSGRCESVRQKTEDWLKQNDIDYCELKMRPIGDTLPEWQLKKKWIMEYLNIPGWDGRVFIPRKHPIDFVFDSDPESIDMWRKQGIFVFDCNQHKEGRSSKNKEYS